MKIPITVYEEINQDTRFTYITIPKPGVVIHNESGKTYLVYTIY